MAERQTQAEKELEQIEQLVQYYLQSGSRQVLTNLRRSTTVLMKRRPGMVYRLEEVFANSGVSSEGIL